MICEAFQGRLQVYVDGELGVSDHEIDLTDASFADFRAAIKPFIRASRQVGGTVVAGSRRGRSSSSTSTKPKRGTTDAAAIRAARPTRRV